MVSYDVRRLTGEDSPAAWELGRLAFGGDRDPPPNWSVERPGRRTWGAFDARGRLVARSVDREQGHWFGGRLVPASGVAGVAVIPELRGSGLARRLLTTLLLQARDRGAVISTLFPTTPAPYRRLGWEVVGTLRHTALPTAALASLARPADVTLRPAEAADVPAVLDAYRTVARAGAGWMERSGPVFDTSAEAVLGGLDGITMADGPDGTTEGYAGWDRGPGYDAAARLTVHDLVGLTGRATSALLAMLGSWASVAPTVVLRLPEPDPAALLATMTQARVESQEWWMLRLVDGPEAVAARGWPPHISGSVDLLVEDDVCPWNAGRHRLVLDAGVGRLEPGGSGGVRLRARGLAVLYAGGGSASVLRRSGLLDGGDDSTDAFLQAATAGPPPALLDYF